MRFSVWPNLSQPWADVLELARHAEATGWDGVYVADHFMGDGGGFGPPESPTLEATAVLSALAATTDRVRIGSLVLGATYRHPAVLANWATTVDHISGGRLVLGLGAGWQENEHEQYGIELGSPGTRIQRFDEHCAIVTGLLRQKQTTVEGEHYVVRNAISELKPVQERLPLLIGGKGDRMLGVVARHADEWNMWSLPETQAERAAALARRCEAIGRDPAEIRCAVNVGLAWDDDSLRQQFGGIAEFVRPGVLGGSDQEVVDRIGTYVEAGADQVNIAVRAPFDLDALERFAVALGLH